LLVIVKFNKLNFSIKRKLKPDTISHQHYTEDFTTMNQTSRSASMAGNAMTTGRGDYSASHRQQQQQTTVAEAAIESNISTNLESSSSNSSSSSTSLSKYVNSAATAVAAATSAAKSPSIHSSPSRKSRPQPQTTTFADEEETTSASDLTRPENKPRVGIIDESSSSTSSSSATNVVEEEDDRLVRNREQHQYEVRSKVTRTIRVRAGEDQSSTNRYSPASLERLLNINMNYLDTLNVSAVQLEELDKVRCVGVAQQETVALAYLLRVIT
jgi:hypothetical protein